MSDVLHLSVLTTRTDKRYLVKTSNEITTREVRLKSGSSIIDPILIMKKLSDSHIRQFNYAFIKEYQRYYFVNDITEMNGDLISVSLHVDVLSSFANDIKGLSCLIIRQENLNNPYFVDEEVMTRVKRIREKKNIGVIGENITNYYLTVNNGGL